MDGPRPARPDELPAVIELSEQVFCDEWNVPRSMARRFPLFLSEANADNLYITCDGGRPVSLVGTDLQTLVTCGCRIPSALVGAVCTLPEYRGQGLAGQLVDFAFRRTKEQGVVLVWISGRRRLYLDRGAVPVWPTYEAEADAGALDKAGDASLVVERIECRDLADMVALQKAEPVRFDWQPEWIARVPLSWMTPPLGAGWLVRRGDRTVAAMYLRGPEPPKGLCRLDDWFGDHQAVLGAVGRAASRMGMSTLSCLFTSYDGRCKELIESAGLAVRRIAPCHRTNAVLDFPRLLEGLRPHLARTIGYEAGAIAATENGFRVILDRAEYVTPDADAATRIVFALPDECETERAAMPQAVRELLDRAFPVPLRHYGLNYI